MKTSSSGYRRGHDNNSNCKVASSVLFLNHFFCADVRGQFPSRKGHTYSLSLPMIKARRHFLPTLVPFFFPDVGTRLLFSSWILHFSTSFVSTAWAETKIMLLLSFPVPPNLQRRSGMKQRFPCISICLFHRACGEPFFPSLVHRLPASLVWPYPWVETLLPG